MTKPVGRVHCRREVDVGVTWTPERRRRQGRHKRLPRLGRGTRGWVSLVLGTCLVRSPLPHFQTRKWGPQPSLSLSNCSQTLFGQSEPKFRVQREEKQIQQLQTKLSKTNSSFSVLRPRPLTSDDWPTSPDLSSHERRTQLRFSVPNLCFSCLSKRSRGVFVGKSSQTPQPVTIYPNPVPSSVETEYPEIRPDPKAQRQSNGGRVQFSFYKVRKHVGVGGWYLNHVRSLLQDLVGQKS